MAETILVVGSDPRILEVLSDMLAREGYAAKTIATEEGALEFIGSEHFSIALVDLDLPEPAVRRIFTAVQNRGKGTGVMAIVGETDHALAVSATQLGCIDFLTKPFDPDKFSIRIHLALERLQTVERDRMYRLALEERVKSRTEEIWDKRAKIQQQFLNTIHALVRALDAKHPYTGGHSRRVADLAVLLARHVGMNAEEVRHVERAALFHDIGKIGVEDSILNKSGKLTAEEYDKVKKHPLIAEEILAPLEEFGGPIMRYVKHEHERVDGRGYPSGLKGEDIPIGSRIIAIADAYDSLVTDRTYRKASSPERALIEIRRCKGTQFDANLVDSFMDVISTQLADQGRKTSLERHEP